MHRPHISFTSNSSQTGNAASTRNQTVDGSGTAKIIHSSKLRASLEPFRGPFIPASARNWMEIQPIRGRERVTMRQTSLDKQLTNKLSKVSVYDTIFRESIILEIHPAENNSIK